MGNKETKQGKKGEREMKFWQICKSESLRRLYGDCKVCGIRQVFIPQGSSDIIQGWRNVIQPKSENALNSCEAFFEFIDRMHRDSGITRFNLILQSEGEAPKYPDFGYIELSFCLC